MFNKKNISLPSSNPKQLKISLLNEPLNVYKLTGTALLKNKENVSQWLDSFARNLDVFSDQPRNSILLASQSPRRETLLSGFFPEANIITYKTDTSEYDYELALKLPHNEALMNIALQKMIHTLFNNLDQVKQCALIITCDTLICDNQGKRIGKIDNEGDPRTTLMKHMGKTVSGISGIVLIDRLSRRTIIDYDHATVSFHPATKYLSKTIQGRLRLLAQDKPALQYLRPVLGKPRVSVSDIISAYITAGRHKGKAGGFGVQDPEITACIRSITGDPTTIIGLPVTLLKNALSRFMEKFSRLTASPTPH